MRYDSHSAAARSRAAQRTTRPRGRERVLSRPEKRELYAHMPHATQLARSNIKPSLSNPSKSRTRKRVGVHKTIDLQILKVRTSPHMARACCTSVPATCRWAGY